MNDLSLRENTFFTALVPSTTHAPTLPLNHARKTGANAQNATLSPHHHYVAAAAAAAVRSAASLVSWASQHSRCTLPSSPPGPLWPFFRSTGQYDPLNFPAFLTPLPQCKHLSAFLSWYSDAHSCRKRSCYCFSLSFRRSDTEYFASKHTCS